MGHDNHLGYYFRLCHMQGQVVMDAWCLPPVQGTGVRFPLRPGVMCQFSFPPLPLLFPTDQYLPSPVATSEPQERHQTKRGREEKTFCFAFSSHLTWLSGWSWTLHSCLVCGGPGFEPHSGRLVFLVPTRRKSWGTIHVSV